MRHRQLPQDMRFDDIDNNDDDDDDDDDNFGDTLLACAVLGFAAYPIFQEQMVLRPS